MRSVAVTVLVLGLLGGSAAAFAVTEALKLERSPITAPRFTKQFSPVCACERQRASMAFRLRRADRLGAAVVDDAARTLRTLIEDQPYRRGEVLLIWDGRDDAGRIVPDGRYRLRVHLAREHRTILMPNPVFVDTTRPTIRILAITPQTFSPDGDGRADKVRIAYVASEAVNAVILVDGTVVRQGHLHRQGKASVRWNGTLQGKALSTGLYSITLRARDRGGNFSHESTSLEARIRYVLVEPSSVAVRRGGELRFHVSSDALNVSWRLVRAGHDLLSGSARPGLVTVNLPIRIRAGRYVLRFREDGHSARAIVHVLRGRA